MHEMDSEGADAEFLGPSRSQQRRDALDVLRLAETLANLSEAQLSRVPLDDELREEVRRTRAVTSHIARKRQNQFLAKQMRKLDEDALTAIRVVLAEDRDSADATPPSCTTSNAGANACSTKATKHSPSSSPNIRTPTASNCASSCATRSPSARRTSRRTRIANCSAFCANSELTCKDLRIRLAKMTTQNRMIERNQNMKISRQISKSIFVIAAIFTIAYIFVEKRNLQTTEKKTRRS
jgi:hypothetical protein